MAIVIPPSLGKAAGEVASEKETQQLIPKILCQEGYAESSFCDSFIRNRQRKLGWPWVDERDYGEWTNKQIGCFLSHLPFTSETWARVDLWLGKHEKEYWKRARVFAYDEEQKLEFAAEKLISFDRPISAIDCIFALRNKGFNKDLAIKALVEAVNSEESKHMHDAYQMLEVIKALQNHPEITPEELYPIEWSYLQLIQDGTGEVAPINLERQMATDPAFFCSMIQLVYRSANEEHQKEASEEQAKIATNAWKLLNEWKIPPGSLAHGEYSGEEFKRWVDEVICLSMESGHREVALAQIGSVLINCPEDVSGLWINKVVANLINETDMESMIDGFRSALFNSRGVHSVDPEGKPEKMFAEKYRQQAEQLEKSGFQRFATTLRNLGDDYARQAEKIIQRYSNSNGFQLLGTGL